MFCYFRLSGCTQPNLGIAGGGGGGGRVGTGFTRQAQKESVNMGGKAKTNHGAVKPHYKSRPGSLTAGQPMTN